MPKTTVNPISIEITREDLAAGQPRSPFHCAIAWSLKRQGYRHPNINARTITCVPETAPLYGPVQRYAPSAEVQSFMRSYDNCQEPTDQARPFYLLLVPPRNKKEPGYACTEPEYQRMLSYAE